MNTDKVAWTKVALQLLDKKAFRRSATVATVSLPRYTL
jgi:hypothetical protein